MIVLRLIERCYQVISLINICNMVADNIKHHPNTFLMCRIDHTNQRLVVSEVGVYFVPVKSSIAMVVLPVVLGDRRNPNSIETHALDVVKLIFDTLESTTAVVV